MFTTSHAILNTALLGRKDKPARSRAALWGGIVPDLPMLLFFFLIPALSRLTHLTLPSRYYYFPYYRSFIDWAHSVPLALAGFLLFLCLKKEWGWVFFLSMFLHDLEDFFVHATYPHEHFLPFSHWKFYGPLSYFDPAYHGAIVAPIEWALVILCSWILYQRDVRPRVQLLLLTVVIFQGAWLVYAFTGFRW
jgi:hypothetical protein